MADTENQGVPNPVISEVVRELTATLERECNEALEQRGEPPLTEREAIILGICGLSMYSSLFGTLRHYGLLGHDARETDTTAH